MKIAAAPWILSCAVLATLLPGLLLAGCAQPSRYTMPAVYPGFEVQIVVDGVPTPQYAAYGRRYVEAVKGREYAIRLHNPLAVRVAVALAVDGLNTIDARHTDARSARKWVLGPYETVTISGWQTSLNQARRFYFTTEDQSYGQMLGKTRDLGIISAVFFRERVPEPPPAPILKDERGLSQPESRERQRSDAAGTNKAQAAPHAALPSSEYAATGFGDRVDHRVTQVHLDLEDAPVATFNIRYEYRAQMVRLGIFPPQPNPDPMVRRQQARGFDGGFCPTPR